MKHRLITLVLLSVFAGTVVPASVSGQESREWLKGVAALQQKNFREAADLLTRAQVPAGDALKATLFRGEALMLAGDYDGALEAFYLADQKSPGISSLWISRTYTLAGNPQKALAWLRTHLQSPWRQSRKVIVMDTILSRLEDTPGWRDLWKNDWYPEKEKRMYEVDFSLAQEQFREAQNQVESLISRYGDDPGLLTLRAKVYTRMGKPEAAVKDYRKALQTISGDTAALSGLAVAEEKLRQYPEAIDSWTIILKTAPERFDLLIKRAEAYARNGQFEKAISDLQQYLSYFPESTETLFHMGNYAVEAGKYTSAMRYYSQVIDRDATSPVYFVARADAYMKARTYRYAAADYSMALDLDPTNGDVYLRRGQALLKTRQKKEACFDFKQALHYGKKEAVTWLQEYCHY
ncbi:MAG: tetratricopeptide repeat protein [Chlorobi bacterium]|nr:tetratricopeptide repeat protein [Chlorobiota bacterium]